MKFQEVPRYEFRRFGANLGRYADAFAARVPCLAQQPSRETYFVTRLNGAANVKIRAHRLQVKVLRERRDGLELWQPVLDAPFPVAADAVASVMAPALGTIMDLPADPLSEAALVSLAKAQAALSVVVVDKERTLYDLEDCEAEFCLLLIGGERLQTVAVESPDAAAALAIVREAGLDGAKNESYAAFLHARRFSIAS